MSALPRFSRPPPQQDHVTLSYPAEQILLVTIDKEKYHNSLPLEASYQLEALWQWYDYEDCLRVAIITGAGRKAFCTGMNLKERLQTQDMEPSEAAKRQFPPSGFAGMSNRVGLKPILVACNGYAFGGGFEIILNADMVIASENATFGLLEGKRGLAALAGALPRVIRNFGLQRAMDLGLTARILPVREAQQWGLVKDVVPSDQLIGRAVAVALEIVELSPESVIVTRAGIREGWESGSLNRATAATAERFRHRLFTGENMREGLAAFQDKRKPVWRSPRL